MTAHVDIPLDENDLKLLRNALAAYKGDLWPERAVLASRLTEVDALDSLLTHAQKALQG